MYTYISEIWILATVTDNFVIKPVNVGTVNMNNEHSGSLHSCTIIESDMPNEILMLIYVNVRLVEALILSFWKFEHFLCNC